MTPQQELRYLSLLLLEASKWQVSEGDARTPLELEIDSRIQRLTGIPEVVIDGRLQASEETPDETQDEADETGEDDSPSDETPEAPSDRRQHKLETQRAWYYKHKDNGLVRVTINGRVEWHPQSECEKEYFSGRKWRWRLKSDKT